MAYFGKAHLGKAHLDLFNVRRVFYVGPGEK